MQGMLTTAALVALAAGCAAPPAPAPPARPSEVAAHVAPQRAEERALRADALFSDHMVLQRDAKAPVWGTATPGMTVTVTLGDQRAEAVADTAGRWIATLPLMEHLGVPVGIIHSSWSGSPIEAWMSAEALASDPSSAAITRMWAERIAANRAEIDAYEPQWRAWRERADRALAAGEPYEQPPEGPEGPRHPWYPSNLYNAMLRPLAPYGIRGFIWYQGEGNRSRATQYRTLFPALIREWRGLFGGGKSGGEPPFLYVQIAGYGKDPPEPAESPSAELREAQLMALDLPRTAMVVTTDISDPEDVHPTNKRDVWRESPACNLFNAEGLPASPFRTDGPRPGS